MKDRYKIAHMKAAEVYASLSYAKRRKVGCVIVQDNRIISIGYNGTPPGEDNCCEDEYGNTKPIVIHAEDNALQKLAEAGISCEGASLFSTTSPCLPCSEKIVRAKIAEVFYSDVKNNHGLEYLSHNEILLEQVFTK